MIFRRILFVFILLLIVAGLIAGGSRLLKAKKAELAKAPKYAVRPVPVHVAVAKLGDLQEKRDYLAVVEPIRVANLSARLTASVEKVLYDEGDRVSKGDVLIELDSREIRQGIAEVQNQIEEARANLASNQATINSLAHSVAYWKREADRDRKLADKGDIPASQAEATADKENEFYGKLEAAKDKSRAIQHLVESLKRKSSQIQIQLSYCTIESPYKGVVNRRLVDPGDLASPGKPLIIVEDRSQLKLAFDVPQQDLPQVREDLDVSYTVGEEQRQAKLSLLYPSLNLARMLRAEVFLNDEQSQGLSPGSYVSLSVILSETKGVSLLSQTCQIESPEKAPYVFVVNEGHLTARPIKILGTTEDQIAVDGVHPGEQVVANTFLGWAVLAQGMKVEVVQ